MKILIINCHWNNRGDEAAIRAMIDELQIKYPMAIIYVQGAHRAYRLEFKQERIITLPTFPIGGKKRYWFEQVSILTSGRINLLPTAAAFYKALNSADIVLHAPGGPSIGDIYFMYEKQKLRRLMCVRNSGVPYAFYAPSMGPFHDESRNPIRKKF